jgi:hypothetical protein
MYGICKTSLISYGRFFRNCLAPFQRRPSATSLLSHPFIKTTARIQKAAKPANSKHHSLHEETNRGVKTSAPPFALMGSPRRRDGSGRTAIAGHVKSSPSPSPGLQAEFIVVVETPVALAIQPPKPVLTNLDEWIDFKVEPAPNSLPPLTSLGVFPQMPARNRMLSF